jgi:hypothetical protein
MGAEKEDEKGVRRSACGLYAACMHVQHTLFSWSSVLVTHAQNQLAAAPTKKHCGFLPKRCATKLGSSEYGKWRLEAVGCVTVCGRGPAGFASLPKSQQYRGKREKGGKLSGRHTGCNAMMRLGLANERACVWEGQRAECKRQKADLYKCITFTNYDRVPFQFVVLFSPLWPCVFFPFSFLLFVACKFPLSPFFDRRFLRTQSADFLFTRFCCCFTPSLHHHGPQSISQKMQNLGCLAAEAASTSAPVGTVRKREKERSLE